MAAGHPALTNSKQFTIVVFQIVNNQTCPFYATQSC